MWWRRYCSNLEISDWLVSATSLGSGVAGLGLLAASDVEFQQRVKWWSEDDLNQLLCNKTRRENDFMFYTTLSNPFVAPWSPVPPSVWVIWYSCDQSENKKIISQSKTQWIYLQFSEEMSLYPARVRLLSVHLEQMSNSQVFIKSVGPRMRVAVFTPKRLISCSRLDWPCCMDKYLICRTQVGPR